MFMNNKILQLRTKPLSGICARVNIALAATVVTTTVTLVGCAAKSPAPESIPPPKTLQESLLNEETNRSQSKEFELPVSSSAQYDFLRGQLALAGEQYDEALQYLERAAKLETSPAPTLRRALAQLYIRTGKVEQALAEVDRALKESPKDVDLLQLRGGLLATKKDVKGAIETYRKILDIGSGQSIEETFVLIASLQAQDSDVIGAKATLNELLQKFPDSFFGHYYLGRMSEAAGELPEAAEHYKESLELNPQADSVQLDLARIYGAQKKFPEAISLVEAYVEENPKNVQARALLAQLLMGDNKVDKAIEQFEQVGSLQQDPTDARLKIALIKLQRRDLEGAITELNLVLAQHPEDNTAHYYLASAYAGLKRIEDAITEIKKIKSGEDYFAESRILGTLILQQEKRQEEALQMINDAAQIKPNDIKILSLRASLEHDLKNTPAAIETMKKVIEIEPAKDRHYFTLGVFLDEADRKQEAVEAMRKAIELEPKNANALNYLGYTMVEQGENLTEAESLIRQALAVEKDNGYFIDSLGWLLFQQGKFQEAVKELEKAAKKVPNDAVILEHYARALIKVGSKNAAETVLKKALEHAPTSDDKEVAARVKSLLDELK